MQAAGWIEPVNGGLLVPGFDEMISKKAVKRFENAQRMAATRAPGKPHVGTHTDTSAHKVPAVPDQRPRVAADGFDRFWAAYPKKKAKADALRAWKGIGPDEALLGRMLAAIERQARSEQWVKDDGAFIPFPATWLRGSRWEDEPDRSGAGVRPGAAVEPPAGVYGRKRNYAPEPAPQAGPDPKPGLFDT